MRPAAGGWVDLDRGLIDFRKGAQAQTNKPRSAIPIPPRLLRFLKAARRRKANAVFVLTYNGKQVGDLKKAFASAAKAAGMPDVHPHTLRHTAVTWLVQKGVPLWKVSGWVEMSEEMIRKVYGHHAPDQFTDVLEALR